MKPRMALAALLVALLSIGAAAAAQDDPFDISATLQQIAELGIPTQATVAALESAANGLFAAGKYADAFAALDAFARNANWLANLIAAALEPFYGASYDDKKGFSYSQLQALATYESLANSYRTKRNHAMIMQAECAVKLGDRPKAVALFVKALDLIDIEDQTWWDRAQKGLYQLIGVS